MSDFNTCIISGRITQSVELRYTPSGTAVCDVNIASNSFNNNKEQDTTFVRTTLWNKQAEWAAEALGVGDTVIVQGRLVDDNYEKDGQRTSGRLKIGGSARLQLVSKRKLKEDESPMVKEPEVPTA